MLGGGVRAASGGPDWLPDWLLCVVLHLFYCLAGWLLLPAPTSPLPLFALAGSMLLAAGTGSKLSHHL